MKLNKKHKKYFDNAMKDGKQSYDYLQQVTGLVFSLRDAFIASLYDLQKKEAQIRKLKAQLRTKVPKGK
jgi:hypothetical protein